MNYDELENVYIRRKDFLTVSDLDDCLIHREAKGWEKYVSEIVNKITPSLVSGMTLVRELIGLENDYETNKDILEYSETNGGLEILTARPYIEKVVEITRQTLKPVEEHVGDVVYYPGRSEEKIYLTDSKPSFPDYFFGEGIKRYKKRVLETLSENYHVAYFDDCEETLEKVKGSGVKTYIVDGKNIEKYL